MMRVRLEVICRLLWARWTLRRAPTAVIRRRWSELDTPDAAASVPQLRDALFLAGVVRRGARRLPWDSNCLVQSVALTAMLRRRGIPGRIEFGVRREEDGAGLAAHAWVTCDGRVILDSDPRGDYASFTRSSE